jgi:uncharacterized protein YjbJ (UPF0337 family)
MTIALPTQVVDAVSSAASTGMEMAGNVLHDVVHAAETASDATSARAHRMLRASRRSLPSRSSGRRGWRPLTLAVLGVVILVAVAIRRSRFGSSQPRVGDDGDGKSAAPLANERNTTVTSPQADDIKGRIKEAAGALTDDDGLKREGKRDQAASTAKDAVDTARDKIEQGIDAVKDKIDKK